MLLLAGAAASPAEAEERLRATLDSGRALEQSRRMIEAQHGDPRVLDDLQRLPQARLTLPAVAERRGFVSGIDAQAVGLAAMALGAGRARKEDAIDPAVGIRLGRKVGEEVAAGEPLAVVLANDEARGEEARRRVRAAYRLADTPPAPRPLIHTVIGAEAARPPERR